MMLKAETRVIHAATSRDTPGASGNRKRQDGAPPGDTALLTPGFQSWERTHLDVGPSLNPERSFFKILNIRQPPVSELQPTCGKNGAHTLMIPHLPDR